MAAEAACIPDPQVAWVRSTMTEAKIQALVDRGLLWPKTEVEWRAAAGEEFPSEDVKEQVVFGSFFERGLTSRWDISSATFYTTTDWSWYTSFLTPLL
jgi:hypothetical protein